MARSKDPLTVTEEHEIWGTWEELLLACAVNRHGAHSWDSVACEVRSRSPYAHRLTTDDCRRRYHHLKRRFSKSESGDGINGSDESDEKEPTFEIPWLNELRRLRVAELRQEVQRYDISIGCLQLKVKKLKEERERSLSTPETDAGDGVKGSGSISGSNPKEENDKQKDRVVSPRSTPYNAGADQVSPQDSGRSCKESNSSEPKVKETNMEERIKHEADLAVNGSRIGSGPDPVTAASFNGSSDTIAIGTVRSQAAEPNTAANDSNESVNESKGGEDAEEVKESSEVQSSASLSLRIRRGRRRIAAAASGDPDAEAVSDAKAVNVESQPLIAFLETIRSNKDGSVFDRRLESQESVLYRSLIRRHVDLEIVQNRIGRVGGYTSVEFFRDLLLICNNSLVFYPKNSPESISAVHLRDFINKEISTTLRKATQTSPQSAKEPTPPPAQLPPLLLAKPKLVSDRTNEKPAPLSPLVACRKRSSITAKPVKPAKKVQKEEKEEPKTEASENEEEETKEKKPNKKSTKQQMTSVARGLRTNKNRTNTNTKGVKNPNPVSTTKPDPIEQDSKSALAKKRSAADFLNRMKSNSPSETTKGSSSLRRGGERMKKMKEEVKREATAVKKSVGRLPAKRAAVPAKRAREEKTPPVAKKRGKK